MAKIKLTIGSIVNVDMAQIHHFHVENSRQESFNNPLSDLAFSFDNPDGFADKGKGLVRALYNGWDESQGVMKAIPIAEFARLQGVTPEEILERAHEERREQIANWESDANMIALANIAKQKWFPDGKPVEILLIGNEAYRRNYALMGVLYKRTLNPSFEGDLSYAVPCKVTTYADELSRLMSHLRENTTKDVGRSEYAPLDYLKMALMTVKALGKENDLVKGGGVKRGTAQKVFTIAQLDQKYPDVRLAERCFLPKEESIETYSPDGYIPLAKLDKEQARRLRDGFSYNDSQQTTEIDVTNETIHEWLRAVTLGKVSKTQAMSHTEIGVLKNHASKLIQDVAKAIGKNDSGFFALLTPHYATLDAAYLAVLEKLGAKSVKTAPEGWDKVETSVEE